MVKGVAAVAAAGVVGVEAEEELDYAYSGWLCHYYTLSIHGHEGDEVEQWIFVRFIY